MLSLILFILGVFNLPVFLASVSLSSFIAISIGMRILKHVVREEGYLCVNVANHKILPRVPDSEFSGSYILSMKNIDNIKSIGKFAFKKAHLPNTCLDLTYSSCTSIRYDAFERSNITSFKGPLLSECEINTCAFENCKSLEYVELNNSILAGTSIFSECRALKSIKITNNNYRIPYRTFDMCDSLEYVQLPDSIRSIEEQAFSSSGIKRIYIPEGVEYIGKEAFKNTSLLEVFLPRSIRDIGRDAFPTKTVIYGYDNDAVLDYVQQHKNMYMYIFKDNGMKYMEYLDFINAEIVDFSKLSVESDETYRSRRYKNIVLPPIKHIGTYMFENNMLYVVFIPDGVVEIEDFAFDRNPLKDIFIPDTVDYIGTLAFGTDRQIIVHCKFGSYAEKWAKFTGREVKYIIKEEEFYAQFI